MGLRILHITDDFSLDNTGITSVLENLVVILKPRIEWVGIYTSGIRRDHPAICDIFYCGGKYNFPLAWKHPNGFKRSLETIISRYNVNILHLHGVWLAAPWIAAQCSREMKVPAIISVHGQMEPAAIKNQGKLKEYKKKLYWELVGRRSIQHVTALHAITNLERKHISRYLPCKTVETIPNSIAIKGDERCQRSDIESNLIFMGRINPIKNLKFLIKSFAKANIKNEWNLIIVGPNEIPQYKFDLEILIDELMMKDRIIIIDPVYGEKKINLLKTSWALILPSLSEVIGMVNLEAAACFLPSITTRATGLDDWENGGGILINDDEDELVSALEKVCSWTISERILKGQESHLLVKEKYSNSYVGEKWLNFYNKFNNV